MFPILDFIVFKHYVILLFKYKLKVSLFFLERAKVFNEAHSIHLFVCHFGRKD